MASDVKPKSTVKGRGQANSPTLASSSGSVKSETILTPLKQGVAENLSATILKSEAFKAVEKAKRWASRGMLFLPEPCTMMAAKNAILLIKNNITNLRGAEGMRAIKLVFMGAGLQYNQKPYFESLKNLAKESSRNEMEELLQEMEDLFDSIKSPPNQFYKANGVVKNCNCLKYLKEIGNSVQFLFEQFKKRFLKQTSEDSKTENLKDKVCDEIYKLSDRIALHHFEQFLARGGEEIAKVLRRSVEGKIPLKYPLPDNSGSRLFEKLAAKPSVKDLLQATIETTCPICLDKKFDKPDTNFAIFDCCCHLTCLDCAETHLYGKDAEERQCSICRQRINEWTTKEFFQSHWSHLFEPAPRPSEPSKDKFNGSSKSKRTVQSKGSVKSKQNVQSNKLANSKQSVQYKGLGKSPVPTNPSTPAQLKESTNASESGKSTRKEQSHQPLKGLQQEGLKIKAVTVQKEAWAVLSQDFSTYLSVGNFFLPETNTMVDVKYGFQYIEENFQMLPGAAVIQGLHEVFMGNAVECEQRRSDDRQRKLAKASPYSELEDVLQQIQAILLQMKSSRKHHFYLKNNLDENALSSKHLTEICKYTHGLVEQFFGCLKYNNETKILRMKVSKEIRMLKSRINMRMYDYYPVGSAEFDQLEKKSQEGYLPQKLPLTSSSNNTKLVNKVYKIKSLADLLSSNKNNTCLLCPSKLDKRKNNFSIFDCCIHIFCFDCAEDHLFDKCPEERTCPICKKHVKAWTTKEYLEEHWNRSVK